MKFQVMPRFLILHFQNQPANDPQPAVTGAGGVSVWDETWEDLQLTMSGVSKLGSAFAEFEIVICNSIRFNAIGVNKYVSLYFGFWK